MTTEQRKQEVERHINNNPLYQNQEKYRENLETLLKSARDGTMPNETLILIKMIDFIEKIDVFKYIELYLNNELNEKETLKLQRTLIRILQTQIR